MSELIFYIATGGRSATFLKIEYNTVSIPGRCSTRHNEYTAYFRFSGEAV